LHFSLDLAMLGMLGEFSIKPVVWWPEGQTHATYPWHVSRINAEQRIATYPSRERMEPVLGCMSDRS
jgi:hypothetical protein